MKKIFYLLILTFLNLSLSAQVSNGGIPRSFRQSISNDNTTKLELISPNNKFISLEDEEDKLHFRIGVSITAGFDLLSEGTWIDLPDGGKICRLQVRSEGALALGVYYDNFVLPDGTDLFIYSEDKTQVIGSFTSNNNHIDRFFATELIHGESIIFEYYEPNNLSSNAIIHITEFAFIYRGYVSPIVKDITNFGNSDPCEVNVNCTPEGSSWQDEKRGVAKILLKEGSNYFWCTGSLVNNVRQDFEPYFLTADHCGHNSTTSDYNQWIFYFNFETVGCTNPSSAPSSNTISGCTKVASGGNSGSHGSDFKLLLFNSYMPTSYNPFYNGWNKINTSSSSGVGIHHPSGDVKKISTYTTSLLTASWNGNYNAHWRVVWTATTNGHGVTEGGSSGSPFFNSSGALIGTLTGGSCSTPTYPDYYGKFSYSWESNGSVPSARLKDWLDPDNTGTSVLSGTNHIITISGLDTDYCIDDQPVALSGVPTLGTFSGSGINGNIFDPTTAGVGTFTITYSTSAGNTSQQVTVHSLPTIDLGSDLGLITGQNINLDAGTGFNSYLWSTGSSTQTINITQGGTYWVEVSNSFGCFSSDTIVITEISGISPGWSYTNTGANHSILVQSTTPIQINGIQIEVGDFIGMFYDSAGVLACGGYLAWTGNIEALSAWGAQAGLSDGFGSNEEFKYKIWDASEDIEHDATATYMQSGFPNQQYYVTNGMSGLASLTATSIITQSQTISISQGWSIFSTYIEPVVPNIDSVMNQISNNVIIVKDGDGVVYWPPFVNMIGDITIGKGYQINMSLADTIEIIGTAVIPENINIVLPSGWSIIGYLRQSAGDVEIMLNSVTGEIIIVKNGSGQVYWPPFVNLIGNLIPGEGYQINLSSSGTLIYSPN